jgi:hypothetical protein
MTQVFEKSVPKRNTSSRSTPLQVFRYGIGFAAGLVWRCVFTAKSAADLDAIRAHGHEIREPCSRPSKHSAPKRRT